MAGPGSGGHVLAALCSFFIPALGQLLQGRLGMAIVHFVLAGVLWFFLLGWLIHLWSIIDAARGFDHGAGHPLLFLDDAKTPNCQKNNGFHDLGNYSEWPKVAGAVSKVPLFVEYFPQKDVLQ